MKLKAINICEGEPPKLVYIILFLVDWSLSI